MASTGFYTLENGAPELLQELYKTADAAKDSVKAATPELLGDSRRENHVVAKADPVEHKGIRLHGWVIGSNKTHITPIDTVDECALNTGVLREDVKELDISYDWTYSTNYKGSLQRLTKSEASPVTFSKSEEAAKVEATRERIDFEKLKEREPILWFEDVGLYEDELHDHGTSAMSVKVVG
ncbi:unnamed protein product [Phytophthora lilii]|uniref:Unnamed protein product n=1 Tax=Phytophthora lilii TaxID=2077276 RepID=A0A9W6WXC2_9STRA|nr:unnamed protein product [Phytophthora lilii]